MSNPEEEFDAFLEEIEFPAILPEIKCYMLRHIFSVDMMPMGTILQELWGDFKFKDEKQMQRFLSSFKDIWNRLAAHQEEGNPYRFTRFPPASVAKELLTRIYVRDLEVQALLPMMEEDIPGEFEKLFSDITEPIKPAIGEMKKILGAAKKPFDAEMMGKWEKELDGIDEKLEEGFNKLGWMLVKIRRGPRLN